MKTAMIEDAELLRRYAEDRSESAFTELVQRHIDFVYAAALRQLGGATHRAEEVTQIVFIALARKSHVLACRSQLAGWLYTSTHYACLKMKRTEQRREEREFEAFTMNETMSDPEMHADWERLRPVLDEAMHELNANDRELILMRFFQGRRFAEVGKEMGVSEDAARMRVERALGKLRVLLARRQITSTSAALGLMLANQPAVAVPDALAATVTGAALNSATVGTGNAVTIFLMKTKTIIPAIAAVLAVGFATYELREVKKARADAAALANERDALHGQLREMQQRVSGAEVRVAELQRQAQTRTIKDVTPFAVPRPAERANPGLSTPGTITAWSFTPEQAREVKGQKVDTTYAPLYRQMGWTQAQREQFRSIMLDRQDSAERLFQSAIAAAKAQNPNIDRAGMLEVFEATNAQMHTEQQVEVARMLGEEASRALQNYQETLPVRAITNQLVSALFNSDAPISPAQADRIAEILAQHSRGPIGNVEVAALKVDLAVAQTQARGILNAAQAEELRRVAAQAQEQSKVQRGRNTTPAASTQPPGK